MTGRPRAVVIRAYHVGFGDCFLLSFDYSEHHRHVLVDFGSARLGKDRPHDLLHRIALDIRQQSHGKLHAVVATHRHSDHINGFAGETGRIIAELRPDVVVQPWTEDPALAPNAKTPLPSSKRALREFTASLQHMELVAQQVYAAAARGQWNTNLARQLRTLSADNVPNRHAIANLWTMGRARRFVYFGAPDPLKRVLPGVRTRVLGPPTLEQSERIRQRRSRDENEFWHFQALATSVGHGRLESPFPRAAVYAPPSVPPDAQVFLDGLHKARGDQLLSLVRAIDSAINNTSVILLIQAGSKKLLFPGDAQIENWSYALSRASEHLRSVDVYKVGHHGSMNATPKTLWRLFAKRGPTSARRRLVTLLSTLANTHGDLSRGTEVPRRILVSELERNSTLIRTDKARRELYTDVVVKL